MLLIILGTQLLSFWDRNTEKKRKLIMDPELDVGMEEGDESN